MGGKRHILARSGKLVESGTILRYGRFKSCMLGLHEHCSKEFEYVNGDLIRITCDCKCHIPKLEFGQNGIPKS